MRFRHMLASVAIGVATLASSSVKAVEIEYWQYVFDTRVKAMNQLITKFQEANPDIKVKQTTFPYADYQTKVAAAILAGQGPDVVQLFYGWTDSFIAGKMIRPLRAEAFPAADIERDFFPIVSAMKRGNDYYGLPTAVRSLALFYNKKIFKEAGLDPNNPPKTLDELVAAAEKTTKRDGSGNIVSAGMTLDMGGQDHQWWREVLIRQFGGVPYTDNDTKVTYNDEAGLKALTFYTDLQTEAQSRPDRLHGRRPGCFPRRPRRHDHRRHLPPRLLRHDQGLRVGRDRTAGQCPGHAQQLCQLFRQRDHQRRRRARSLPLPRSSWNTSPRRRPWRSGWTSSASCRPVVPRLSRLRTPLTRSTVRSSRGWNMPIPPCSRTKLAQRQIAIDMVNRVLIGGEEPKASLAKAAEAEQAILDRAKR